MLMRDLPSVPAALFRTFAVSLALVAFAAMSTAVATHAELVPDDDCLSCHDGSEDDVPAVTPAAFEGSIHEGFSCVDCHVDITEVPHDEELEPAACGECHSDMVDMYTQHGLGFVGIDPDLPTCSTCHGSHDIREVSDPESITHPSHREKVCGQCHGDINFAKEHDITLKNALGSYETSVHGLAHLADGSSQAATCSDCHGTGRNVHLILPAGNSMSAINHFNIPNTCGQCHEEESAAYWEGIHGEMARRGDTHVPVCTDCHGEHGILPPDDPRSNVSPFRVAESTCTPCHETARINERYEAPVGETIQFVDSFHGLKSKSGDATVANCASCHEPHRTLPPDDPRSQVNPQNLQTTCGHCHQSISAEMAQIPIHQAAAAGGWPDLIKKIYIALIVCVIGGMLGYVTLDFIRQTKRHLGVPQVTRMDGNAVLQHTLLMTTFIILVFTGFALRYSDYFPFRQLFGWDGGFNSRGLIHRIAAVVFVISSFYHLFWLFAPKGRDFVKKMAPGVSDVKELTQAVRYNLGQTDHHPHFGRFSFVEKAEYWALVWGTVVMAGTGLLLWFKNDAVAFVSREFLQVMRVIHLYEAWLATLAILVWHMYSVLLKPGVYPGNPSWITGKMPKELYIEEHAREAAELGIEGHSTHSAAPGAHTGVGREE